MKDLAKQPVFYEDPGKMRGILTTLWQELASVINRNIPTPHIDYTSSSVPGGGPPLNINEWRIILTLGTGGCPPPLLAMIVWYDGIHKYYWSTDGVSGGVDIY